MATIQLGPWTVNYEDASERLEQKDIELMEYLLNTVWTPLAVEAMLESYPTQNLSMNRWGVPSWMIRVDFPPISKETMVCMESGVHIPGIYEVETNPSGQGITSAMGGEFPQLVADALLSVGVDRIGYNAVGSRGNQLEEIAFLMDRLASFGISGGHVDPCEEIVPLWMRAGEEDAHIIAPYYGRCLLSHRSHKGYLMPMTGARSLSEVNGSAFEMFPAGFSLKPLGGWGSRGVEVYSPHKNYRKDSTTRTRMERVIANVRDRGEEGQYLVQPFIPPQIVDGGKAYKILRIFAVYDPSRRGYRILGGMWAKRGSTKIHGAGDTICGLVTI